MKKAIKRIVLANGYLRSTVMYFHKRNLKRKYQIEYEKNSFIGMSVVCEGRNSFAANSCITSSKIGFGSYLAAGSQISKTEIGRYTSIGPNVMCIFGRHPADTFVSTHPLFFSTKKRAGISYTNKQLFEEFAPKFDEGSPYSIQIGNDVWIGANVSIIDGVRIGDGAIIAANALVNKDVPPFTIVGGVPAKFIKDRFSEKHIKFLTAYKWWNKPESWVRENAPSFTDIEFFYQKFANAQ